MSTIEAKIKPKLGGAETPKVGMIAQLRSGKLI